MGSDPAPQRGKREGQIMAIDDRSSRPIGSRDRAMLAHLETPTPPDPP